MEPYWDLIARIVKESDLVLEVLDARLIELSRNEQVEQIIEEIERPLIFVINKSDLVSKKSLKNQIKKLGKKHSVVFVSSKRPKDVKILLYEIRKVFKKYGKREPTVRKFGDPKIKTREAKADIVVGVLGYPNVGKSSIINALSHRKKVKVSKKAGTTHGAQWVRSSDIKLIDTPGVIPLKKDDEIRYGLIGARTDKIKNPEIIAHALIKLFFNNNKKNFEDYYKIKMDEDPEVTVENIANKKRHLLKKGEVDSHRTCSMIVRDWQQGKLKF